MRAMAVPIALVRCLPPLAREAPKAPGSGGGGEAADGQAEGEVAAVLAVWERRPGPGAPGH